MVKTIIWICIGIVLSWFGGYYWAKRSIHPQAYDVKVPYAVHDTVFMSCQETVDQMNDSIKKIVNIYQANIWDMKKDLTEVTIENIELYAKADSCANSDVYLWLKSYVPRQDSNRCDSIPEHDSGD